MKRLSNFIGQPIYSLKDVCLGGDTVEKPMIFGGQEDVLLKGGGLENKIRKLNRFNSAIESPRYALSDFYRTAMIAKRLLCRNSRIES